MPTIADYLKYANLQMAAEAFLKEPTTGDERYIGDKLIEALKDGNKHASKFTATQAAEFADPVKGWTVLDQCKNTSTGFSGTLFKNNQTNEYVISMRSTEFIDDAVRDSASTNTLEVFRTGWAWGQISDMDAWYQSIKSQIPTSATLNVTGYSLGGHLATAFNLLHQSELNGGQVVTFNGAGVGQIKAGDTPQSILAYFNELRQSPGLIKTKLDLTLPALAAFYDTLHRNLADHTWTARDAKNELANFNLDGKYSGTQLTLYNTEKKPLEKALTDIVTLQDEAARIKNYTSGGTPSTSIKVVPDTEILAETLDYRLAVDLASQRTNGVISVLNKTPAPTTLTNQTDLVGMETATDMPWSAVANSGVHYGTPAVTFIEDQPLARGSFLKDLVKGMTGFELNLLQDRYDPNSFGDTHSLVLIVDSLNVQNALLSLLPEAQRQDATEALQKVLLEASWRKAESATTTIGVRDISLLNQ